MSLNKLKKVNDNFTVNMYDNGYMIEVGGRSDNDDWISSKIVCNTIDDVLKLIKEVDAKPRAE